MNRRSFLQLLGLAAPAVIAPTKTYAFFGGILRPRPDFRGNGELRIGPPELVIPNIQIAELQGSVDGINWEPYKGALKLVVEPFGKPGERAGGLVDRLMVVSTDDVMDLGPVRPTDSPRYLRVQHLVPFSKPSDPNSYAPQFVVRPVTEEPFA